LESISAAEGFEIDPYYGVPTVKLWQSTPLKLHVADFTRTSLPSKEDDKFNLIICNPPYVRHHHIPSGEKARLQNFTMEACRTRITGLAGLYCYFLGLSHAWMSNDGIAGWLIPSEFMDVNYGLSVKHYLLNEVRMLRIHRFDPKDVQFGDALVSSVLVWLHNSKPPVDYEVEYTFGGTLAQPKVSRKVSVAALHHERKWTRFPLLDVRDSFPDITLKDFFTVKRGLATGNNSFFILSREEIQKRKLPMKFFRPILPSVRYIPSDEVLANPDGTPSNKPQLFLLDCRLTKKEVKRQSPKLWAYLEEGKRNGVHQRYLCKHRTPWYAQESRPPSPFIFTYMGRSNKKTGRAFRFILNRSQATVTNSYLILYPKPALADALESKPYLAKKIWQALNEIQPSALLEEGRVYGGGLHKLEPKELENVSAAKIAALLPE
jgi:hypothetical protein